MKYSITKLEIMHIRPVKPPALAVGMEEAFLFWAWAQGPFLTKYSFYAPSIMNICILTPVLYFSL